MGWVTQYKRDHMSPDLIIASRNGISDGMSVVVSRHCLMCCSLSSGVPPCLMRGMALFSVTSSSVAMMVVGRGRIGGGTAGVLLVGMEGGSGDISWLLCVVVSMVMASCGTHLSGDVHKSGAASCIGRVQNLVVTHVRVYVRYTYMFITML